MNREAGHGAGKRRTTVLAALSLLVLAGQLQAAGDVRILRNDATGITVRYCTGAVSWQPLQVGQKNYRTPVVEGVALSWPAGSPQLPEKVIWLAIPPGSKPRLAAVTPYALSSPSGVPAPVPLETTLPGGSTKLTYNENPLYYSSSSPFPVAWAQLQDPSTYRDLYVVRLLVYPFRFTSSSGLSSLDSIDLQIQLQGGSGVHAGAPVRPLEDEFYQGLIANWQGETKSWKLPRQAAAELTDPWPAGDLYKIRIDASGMYRLTYNDLVNAGINLSDLDPRTLRLFNNGGEILPKNLNVPRPTGPLENAILVQGEDDGHFDPGDEIWFYGKSVHEWKWNGNIGRYQHYRNPYTDYDVYWLNVNKATGAPAGKRMAALGQPGSASLAPTTSRAYFYEEKEQAITDDGTYGLPTQMPNFWGDYYSGSSSRIYNFSLENVAESLSSLLVLQFTFPESGNTFKVYVNNNYISTTSNLSYTVTLPAGMLHSGVNSLRLEHSGLGAAYIDYYEIEYTRNLATTSGKMAFFSPAANGLADYNLSTSGLSSPWIFDVTNFADVKYAHASEFTDSSYAASPRRYLAVNSGAWSSPISIVKDTRGGDEYANLYSTLGADELVICGDEFYDAMAPFETYRETQAPVHMDVLRVRVSDIYDDFGWGLPDPAAIRDFLKATLPIYNWAISPLYVLFAGDGDWDYKNRLASDGNWVIPFESGGRCTDDWYSYFQPTDDSNCFPELATGRWPVRSVEEVQTMISRLIDYESGNHYGAWQDVMTFVADDEHHPPDNNSETSHVNDTENLAENYVPSIINVQKIYLTEYPATWDPIGGGLVKLGAATDLVNGINEGRLLVNFIGHGNPTVWADERVFLQNRDLPLLNNGYKLPLFIAGTCDWAYWDSPFDQSMPEVMLTLPGGGAISVIAATRTTTSFANSSLLQMLFQELFSQPGGRRQGEALMRAKADFYNHSNLEPNKYNNESYHVLGDPVMKLAIPELSVALEATCPDTLNALQQANLSGEIRTASGTPLPSFTGVAHLQVFDTRIPVTYLVQNNSITPTYLHYTLPGNAIFRGDCSVQNGHFSSNFIVPLDMNYGGSGGRYSVYAYPGEGAEPGASTAAGADTGIFFSQTPASLQDTIPPTLGLYFDSPGFRPGDTVSPTSVLYVQVSDSNGVNLTGSTGHGITITVDDQSPIDLTQAFNYNLDSWTVGRAQYQFAPGQLTPGAHSVQAIAWDAANNPNTAQTTFSVVSVGQLAVNDVLNYPNPMRNSTRFTFTLSEPAQVSIRIYTVAGRLVKDIEGINGNASFNYSDPLLTWDGRDERGDPVSNGVYLYKVTASGAGAKAEKIGKLMVLR